MVGTRCPFAQGDYQVAVQGGSFCSGDAQTAATVQDDYLIIYCVSGDQFASKRTTMLWSEPDPKVPSKSSSAHSGLSMSTLKDFHKESFL